MIFGKFEVFLIENYNFSMNITERDGILLENIPIYSKVSVFDQICSFSVKSVIFPEIYNFSIKDTKWECTSMENFTVPLIYWLQA